MLETRALLVRVVVYSWPGVVADKALAKEVAQRKGTSFEKLIVKKKLLYRRLATLRRVARETRKIVRTYTLPWDDSGWRLLPSELFFEFTSKIAECQREYRRRIENIISYYTAELERERRELGDLFNPKDYPTPEELRSRFMIVLDYQPVPTSGDFRVDMVADALIELKAQLEKKHEEALLGIKRYLREQIQDTAERLIRCLDRKVPKVTPALLKDTARLAQLLPPLNIVEDNLIKKAAELLREISMLGAEELRKNLLLRSVALQKARQVSQLLKEAEDAPDRTPALHRSASGF